jgi:hypothetical protein
LQKCERVSAEIGRRSPKTLPAQASMTVPLSSLAADEREFLSAAAARIFEWLRTPRDVARRGDVASHGAAAPSIHALH